MTETRHPDLQHCERSLRQARLLRWVGVIGFMISAYLCAIPFQRVTTGDFLLAQNLFKFLYPAVLLAISQSVLGMAKRSTRDTHMAVTDAINRRTREGCGDSGELTKLQDLWFALAMADWRTRLVQWIGYLVVAIGITGVGVWFIAGGLIAIDAFTLLLMVPIGLAYVLPAFALTPGRRPQPLRRR